MESSIKHERAGSLPTKISDQSERNELPMRSKGKKRFLSGCPESIIAPNVS